MFRYAWISLLFFLTTPVIAQENSASDSVRRFHKPTGIRFGTDLISIGKDLAKSSLMGWEANADVDFGRYYLAVDYGSWSREHTLVNGDYKNDGRYFRVGVDIDFLLKDPDKNMFFLGFRYAHSNFNEHTIYQVSVIDFGDYQIESSNIGARANWAELTAGLRVKIWKQFWMGYTGRMKFLPSVKGNDFDPYEIPGYGRTFKPIYWGFNYQIFYRIPIRS